MPWKFMAGRLWSPHGHSWPAVSGPYGKGRLPDGTYHVERPVLTEEEPMKDTNGFGWKAKLIPLFMTGRYALYIHPDGGVTGTLGCIGVSRPVDTRPLYNDLMSSGDRVLVVGKITGNRSV